MIKLSAIILADNREEIVTDCLKSIVWIKEKIVVDLGSTDKTIEIAKKYGCRVIKGGKEYNFSKWRNQGAQISQGDWLLYIDTDERVTKELQEEILLVINQPKRHLGGEICRHLRGGGSVISAFYIPRKNYFWGKEFKSEWPDYQLRLIRKDKLIKWQGNIHETPLVQGEISKLKNPLIHLSHRNLDSCLANTLKWSWLEAENRYKVNHPKMVSARFLRVIATGFYEQFIKRKIWREGTVGVIEGIYQIFSLFITYVRLWELQNK